MGGLVRCVECGEVHWNLLESSRPEAAATCRTCGSELRDERRRPGRRFDPLGIERRDAHQPGDAAGFGGGPAS